MSIGLAAYEDCEGESVVHTSHRSWRFASNVCCSLTCRYVTHVSAFIFNVLFLCLSTQSCFLIKILVILGKGPPYHTPYTSMTSSY